VENDRILLAHGGGGELMRELVVNEIARVFGDPELDKLGDSALVEVHGARLAVTTDSYVVKPVFFPGGDIGRLAVCGTVNDLAVAGAVPGWLTFSIIVEEGFPLESFRLVIASAAAAATEAGVRIVAGDTKVVERGSVDEIFITTAGVGGVPDGVELGPHLVEARDAVILTGMLGDHGIAVMSKREGLKFVTPVESDVAPLGGLLTPLARADSGVRCMKDPTRGGLAACLNEIAEGAAVQIEIEEDAIPVRPAVAGACDLLGLDVLTVANEGKAVIIAASASVDGILERLRSHPFGRDAAVIGTVRAGRPLVVAATAGGGERVVDMPYGEELPRIC